LVAILQIVRPAMLPKRAFTLVEAAITMAIITIIGIGALTVVRQVKLRNSFTSSVAGVQVGLRKLKADAWGSGFNTVFVVNQSTGQYWGIEDQSKTFSLSTFSASSPAPSPNVLLFKGTLPSPVTFGPSTGYVGGTLPWPFATVHVASACTFCVTSPANYGAVTFTPEGTAFLTGTNTADGSFSIQTKNDKTNDYTYTTIAIIGLTAAIETFEGTHT
jgi:hypothetical protein